MIDRPVWYVSAARSAAVWRGGSPDELAFEGFLPRDLSPSPLVRPNGGCRFLTVQSALLAARLWVSHWLDFDDYWLTASVLDSQFRPVTEIRGVPVRVLVTTRTLSGKPDSGTVTVNAH